jgi:superfamily II DNA or RNA helicase/HKD family nuclease
MLGAIAELTPNGTSTTEERVQSSMTPQNTQGSLFDDEPPAPAAVSSIIDNRNQNTLLARLETITAGGRELAIASAFFSLDGLALLGPTLAQYSRIRILFGDDASATERRKLLRIMRERSDSDLLLRRTSEPTLESLRHVARLFEEGRVEARCYTKNKFHAKAYLVERPDLYPALLGIIGSGNFTRPGLTQNVELNVELTLEQTSQLRTWFEERWQEAESDIVTDDMLDEIKRQIDLYDPYVIYLKALLAWGSQQEEAHTAETSALLAALDPHQMHGYLRAAKLISTHNGCMVCDGVGLGKSFIALAIMERYCREGRNVLLIAPKNILQASWQTYLTDYLDEYLDGWGGLRTIAMTDLGFLPEDKTDEHRQPSEAVMRRRAQLHRWWRAADLVVIDESHNFRASAANRYRNLFQMLAPYGGRRKRVMLMTATPINTEYRDIANQLALITHDSGNIAGYSAAHIRRVASALDGVAPLDPSEAQTTLDLFETPDRALNRVLEAVVIQRGRATVKELARAVGKEVHFPVRHDPQTIDIVIGDRNPAYRDLVRIADSRFTPTAHYIRDLRKRLQDAGLDPDKVLAPLTPPRAKGIKLAAFLTQQYRRKPDRVGKTYRDEVHLAGLVFTNTLKQLESSPVAFQGILQSLGMGLLARLRHVFGDDADDVVAEHARWVRTRLFEDHQSTDDDNGDEEDPEAVSASGESLDASGEETDDWLDDAIRARGLQRKLADFTEPEFDTRRWRRDIEDDLDYLREIHQAAIEARQHPDPKLLQVLEYIKGVLADNRRLLIFTQSRRTAEYLERELKRHLPERATARIDSRVEDTRQAILHAFCPNYNPRPSRWPPSVPEKLDILISTDVLSEGVNLQDAGAILSYDIHWNPVRLIQRIGRVDRRIDPAKTPLDHSFDIYNVLPPEEIDEIIGLVGTVEGRTLKISKALGLDVSFFKSTDPAGNLKEFNAMADGDVPPIERAHSAYAGFTVHPPAPEVLAAVERMPPGAFGVWAEAPCNGLFAMFTMQPTSDAGDAERDRFSDILGRVVLVAEREDAGITTNAGKILDMLAATVPGVRSGLPSDEARLSRRLADLRDHVRSEYADVGLPRTIRPRLECWMEMRRP